MLLDTRPRLVKRPETLSANRLGSLPKVAVPVTTEADVRDFLRRTGPEDPELVRVREWLRAGVRS